MTFLKAVFLICIFFLVYALIEYFYYKNNKNIIEAKGEYNKKSYNAFLKLQQKLEENKKIKGLFYKKEMELKRIGYPLKLNGFKYYMLKTLILVLFFCLSLSGNLNTSLVIATLMMLLLPNLMCKLIKDKENLQILGDLPYINDVLNIQSSAAGMDLGTSLTEVFDVAKSKRFKEKLIQLSIEINLTKNIPEALEHFIEHFDLPELDSFVLAIKQSVKTGRTKELLDSQSELLKDASLVRINAKTKEISLWIGLVGGLMFLGIASLMLFSFGSLVYEGLKSLF